MIARILWLSTVVFAEVLIGAAGPAGPWWNPEWHARVRIEVDPGGVVRYSKPVEIEVDFTALLKQVGLEGRLDEINLRLVELDRQYSVVDEQVPFQFDKSRDYDSKTNAAGRLLFMCTGSTPAAKNRIYELYFDTVETFRSKAPARIEPQVSVSDNIEHEGQLSIRIASPSATYYYHKGGAGFASLEDRDSLDWIGYRPCCESGGEYRGIPNLWNFHPGEDSCLSKVESWGPLGARLHSWSLDEKWECTWDIFPDYARLNLLKVDGTYWFLYEGIPGGSLEVERDYNVLSTGLRRSIAESWHGDLPAPEWLYFGDDRIKRALFLVHLEDDVHSDQFWQMRREMVVFGFGREYPCCGTYMDLTPAHFIVGFAEDSVFSGVASQVNNAYRPIAVKIGTAEILQQ